MTLNLPFIAERLHQDEKIRNRILRDYCLTDLGSSADEFARGVVAAFDTKPDRDPLSRAAANPEVFQAAVKALASNMRAWSTFLKSQPELLRRLYGCDPVQAHQALRDGRLPQEKIEECLSGTTRRSDARAICKWAAILTEMPNYQHFLQDLGRAFQSLSQERFGKVLPDSLQVLCMAGFLGDPPRKWAGQRFMAERSRNICLREMKTPGMSYVLASEFLRNLRWSAFKPDRHVHRLFDRWMPDAPSNVEPATRPLLDLIGRSAAGLRDFLTYGLIGIAVTPAGVEYSFADNLVWLLGAYVEKKGHESNRSYLVGNLNVDRLGFV